MKAVDRKLFRLPLVRFWGIPYHAVGAPALQPRSARGSYSRDFRDGPLVVAIPLTHRNYPPDPLDLPLALARTDRRRLRHAANVPTLIVWGQQDRLIPPVYAEEYKRLLPSARISYIDECGHDPTIEQPEAFAQAVVEFLR